MGSCWLSGGHTHLTGPSDGESVSQIVCGEHHTVLVMDNGTISTCGGNSRGQLGRASAGDPHTAGDVEGVTGVVSVACGQDHSLALCESGRVFSWGRSSEGQLGTGSFQDEEQPSEVPLPPLIPIIQVACGNQHSLALTKGGEVFSWGHNNFGQLGLGEMYFPQVVLSMSIPCRLLCLTGVPVIQVSAGGGHSLALSLSGQVYGWGANHAGQLGLNRVDEKGCFSACAAPALGRLRVASISCGSAHTAVLTEAGEVFTFGEGSLGQLGHNTTVNELKPRRVQWLQGAASQIACGSHHTLVLMASGVLQAFGSGLEGKLENRSAASCFHPSPVQLSWHVDGVTPLSGLTITSGWHSSCTISAAPQSPEKGKQIYTLDTEKLQTWMTPNPESGQNRNAEREISQSFSSCSSLMASFINGRETELLSINILSVRQMFDHLCKVSCVKPLIRALVTNLSFAARLMVSVEIFLVLPECQLFHEKQNVTALVAPLAGAIVNLSQSALQRLRDLWSSMELETMTKHIRMWKQALAFLVQGSNRRSESVKHVLLVLQHLHQANSKGLVPGKEFILENVCLTGEFLQEDIQLWFCQADGAQAPPIFIHYPFVLSLESKLFIFTCTVNAIMGSYWVVSMGQAITRFSTRDPSIKIAEEKLILRVRRSTLVNDAFRQLRQEDTNNFRKPLVVIFEDDLEQQMTMVNTRDFFYYIFKELLKSGIFVRSDSGTAPWFPPKTEVDQENYFLFGVLCAMALHNSNRVNLPFPLGLFKKLLDVKTTLEDLKELCPTVWRSLQYVLDYSDDDVENMDMYYTVTWNGEEVELDPSDKGKRVTSDNKFDAFSENLPTEMVNKDNTVDEKLHEFVRAYVDYILNKSAEPLFGEFKRGFFSVCDKDLVQIFQPEELRELMVGTENYDWRTFKQNTVYKGKYHANHKSIRMFWMVFDKLSLELKKGFLLFLTGCELIPILGIDQIQMKIQSLNSMTKHHFPTSLTCHQTLYLPVYPDRNTLETKLTVAINTVTS